MSESRPRYDLEDRTYRFAKRTRDYIEANEALSKKDFRMRIKICRKESKESGYHLRLLDTHGDAALDQERDWLVNETVEFVKIFNTILRNSEDR